MNRELYNHINRKYRKSDSVFSIANHNENCITVKYHEVLETDSPRGSRQSRVSQAYLEMSRLTLCLSLETLMSRLASVSKCKSRLHHRRKVGNKYKPWSKNFANISMQCQQQHIITKLYSLQNIFFSIRLSNSTDTFSQSLF